MQTKTFFLIRSKKLTFRVLPTTKTIQLRVFSRLILNMIKTRPQVISPIHKLRKNGTKFGFDDFWDSLGKQLFFFY